MTDKYIPAELSQQQIASNEAMKPKVDSIIYSTKMLFANLRAQNYSTPDRIFCDVINNTRGEK